MKYLLYSDNHFCQYSSIIRSRGDKYSLRLENQIATLTWIKKIAFDHNVDAIFNLGDFFDKPDLNVEEITALSELDWSGPYDIILPHYFIVGNHEIGLNTNEYNSANIFNLIPNSKVFSEPQWFNHEVFILPYILESNRGHISDYTGHNKPKIILSHNDIKGVQMGQFISQTGFDISEIQDSCRIFINGHLHNSGEVAKGIINIGNITGQNFNEDADKYGHHALILDTEEDTIEEIENPYAFNFYKLDFTNNFDLTKKLKPNAVVSVKVQSEYRVAVNEWLKSNNVIASRVIIDLMNNESDHEEVDTLSVDHIQRFKEFIIEKMGSSEIVLNELEEVTK